ncbi:hypothetical protein ACFL5O_08735 [Myxococcota bacterium]
MVTGMSKESPQSDEWPGFEVAIEGQGFSPADVPVRQLAELLEAAAAAVDAIAAERGIKLPAPRLVAVRAGSAAYDLRIPDASAGPLVAELEKHIAARGKDSSLAVRHALERFHRAGRVGSVRFCMFRSGPANPLYVAPPLEQVVAPFEAASEVYGQIVAVAERGNRLVIRLRLDDGQAADFEANQDTAQRAARLFLRCVHAEVLYDVEAGHESPATITDLEPWDDSRDEGALANFDAAREQLMRNGVHLRASDWLRELGENE